MELSVVGGEPLLAAAMQQLLDLDLPDELERQLNPPTRAYVRDRRAMANTPMDVKELRASGALVLAVDMPGVAPADVRVEVEDGNVLAISGERRRPAGDDGEGVKYRHREQEAAAGAQEAARRRGQGRRRRGRRAQGQGQVGEPGVSCHHHDGPGMFVLFF